MLLAVPRKPRPSRRLRPSGCVCTLNKLVKYASVVNTQHCRRRQLLWNCSSAARCRPLAE